MIDIRGLSFTYSGSERPILRDVDLHIVEGEAVLLAGPSGGGKSTLLRCLNYLEGFDAGEVEIAGVTLRPGRRVRIRRCRAFVRRPVVPGGG